MPSASEFGQLIDYAAAAIAGASLPFTVTVDSRKRPAVLETDTLPLVLCCPLRREPDDEAFDNLKAYRYRVVVAVVTEHKDFLKQDMDNELLMLEKIPQVLFNLPTVATAYDVEVNLNPSYDPQGLDARYDYSFIEVVFTNQEVRAA